MDADEAVAAIRTLGERVIPAVKALDPATAINLRPHDRIPHGSEKAQR